MVCITTILISGPENTQGIWDPNVPILCLTQLLGCKIGWQCDMTGVECNYLSFMILQDIQ